MTDIKRKSGLFPQMDGLSLQSPLRFLSVLVICLFLTKYCKGQSQLMGSPQPIVATVGDNIILPCHLEPAVDVAAMTLEWTRSDLKSTFAFVWRAEKEVTKTISPSYKGRTSLFTDELERGNISLKLSDVRPSDAGRYKCYIPDMLKGSFIELVVGAASSPVISLAGIDRDKGGVVLQCESAGWHPEPEVLWLDGEGKLLSAGPTETVRGPDDLYTVSSRVTVEKRHSNSFTCRVQQRNINQTRETHIQVPDDFFKVQSSSSSITTSLAVSLAVCILLILFLSFFAWKWRQMKIKTERRHRDETEEGRRNHSETNRTDYHLAAAEETKPLKGKEEKKSKHWPLVSRQRFQEEQQRREEAENKVQILEEELQTKTAELQDEHTRREEAGRQVQRKQQELQKKTQELEGNQAETNKQLQQETQQKDRAQSEVQNLKNQLETKTKEKKKKKKKKESEEKVKTLKDELQNKNTQLEVNQDVNIRLLQLETQEKDNAQSEVQALKKTKEKELQEEKRRMKLDEEVKTFKEVEF
ncbi:butyrophilin subfamily 3 member A2-like [Epinephelus moara]|uniref:butyrophilin subfamily 3 member A2-like n=1 Tax=Epinephelus moara TaxID=300413 RepID=UPI00214EAB17|nr:butyrophilin subfamily 3 member A2-like [Epinephelus moara]